MPDFFNFGAISLILSPKNLVLLSNIEYLIYLPELIISFLILEALMLILSFFLLYNDLDLFFPIILFEIFVSGVLKK